MRHIINAPTTKRHPEAVKIRTRLSKAKVLLLALSLLLITSSMSGIGKVGWPEGTAVGLRVSTTTLMEVASTVAPVDEATAEEKAGSARAAITDVAATLTEST